jgi:hypothetical protein
MMDGFIKSLSLMAIFQASLRKDQPRENDCMRNLRIIIVGKIGEAVRKVPGSLFAI